MVGTVAAVAEDEAEVTDDEFTQIETRLSTITIHGNRTDHDIAKLRSMD